MTSLGLPPWAVLSNHVIARLINIQMMIFSSYSRECDKHNVYVFGILSERVSERRPRKQDTDIGLDLHINVIGRRLFIEWEFTLYSKKYCKVYYESFFRWPVKTTADLVESMLHVLNVLARCSVEFVCGGGGRSGRRAGLPGTHNTHLRGPLIRNAHEWNNKIPIVSIYYLAKPKQSERAESAGK